MALSIFLLAIMGIVLGAAIRQAGRTFRKIYIDRSGETPSAKRLLGTLAWNYFSAILTFALLYRILSTLEPNAFSVPFEPFDGLYLSIVVISGTGFGDILPKSDLAKLVVCTEIVFGYFLTVILFSSFAGLAFRKAADRATSQRPGSE